LRPTAEKEALQISFANVAEPDPDHFGGWPVKYESIEEISVPRDDIPVSLSGMFPELSVGRLLAEVGGMRTRDGNCGCERRRQIFVDQQVIHEAS